MKKKPAVLFQLTYQVLFFAAVRMLKTLIYYILHINRQYKKGVGGVKKVIQNI